MSSFVHLQEQENLLLCIHMSALLAEKERSFAVGLGGTTCNEASEDDISNKPLSQTGPIIPHFGHSFVSSCLLFSSNNISTTTMPGESAKKRPAFEKSRSLSIKGTLEAISTFSKQ